MKPRVLLKLKSRHAGPGDGTSLSALACAHARVPVWACVHTLHYQNCVLCSLLTLFNRVRELGRQANRLTYMQMNKPGEGGIKPSQ